MSLRLITSAKTLFPNNATLTDSESSDLGVSWGAMIQPTTVIRSYFCVGDVVKGTNEVLIDQNTQKGGGGSRD